MDRQRISDYSWIALGGFVVAAACFPVGLILGLDSTLPNDRGVMQMLTRGGLAAVAIGGFAVQLMLGRAGRAHSRAVSWLVSPGAFVGVPFLAAGAIDGEYLAAFTGAGLLIGVSGLATEACRILVRARGEAQ